MVQAAIAAKAKADALVTGREVATETGVSTSGSPKRWLPIGDDLVRKAEVRSEVRSESALTERVLVEPFGEK